MADALDSAVDPREGLAGAIAGLPGVAGLPSRAARWSSMRLGDALIPLMTVLRDREDFAFEQVMDICGVDWPSRL